jgi:hypothetical protein
MVNTCIQLWVSAIKGLVNEEIEYPSRTSGRLAAR